MKKIDPKVKRVIRKTSIIAINVLTVIICVFVLIFAIISISNGKNGYNNVFGSTVLAVKTGSMSGPNKDSFDEGDLIVAKILKGDAKKELQKGDVITFWTLKDGSRELNTHRIIDVETSGGTVYYTTKGDASTGQDDLRVPDYEVVAKYSYKIKNLGEPLNFLQSSTGFLVLIVVPSILAVGYCVYLFMFNLRGYNKAKKAEQKELMQKQLEEEKEKIKKELLEQMSKGEKK